MSMRDAITLVLLFLDLSYDDNGFPIGVDHSNVNVVLAALTGVFSSLEGTFDHINVPNPRPVGYVPKPAVYQAFFISWCMFNDCLPLKLGPFYETLEMVVNRYMEKPGKYKLFRMATIRTYGHLHNPLKRDEPDVVQVDHELMSVKREKFRRNENERDMSRMQFAISLGKSVLNGSYDDEGFPVQDASATVEDALIAFHSVGLSSDEVCIMLFGLRPFTSKYVESDKLFFDFGVLWFRLIDCLLITSRDKNVPYETAESAMLRHEQNLDDAEQERWAWILWCGADRNMWTPGWIQNAHELRNKFREEENVAMTSLFNTSES